MNPALPSIELSPAAFPEAQSVLRCPDAMPDCRDLYCYNDGQNVVSSWPLPWRARLAILLGARIWLNAWGNTHPPIALTVSKAGPFVPPGGEP